MIEKSPLDLIPEWVLYADVPPPRLQGDGRGRKFDRTRPQPTFTLLGGRVGSGRSWFTSSLGPVDRSRAIFLDVMEFVAELGDPKKFPESRNLNKYILEQIPVVPPESYTAVRFGPKTVGDIVRQAVLELTYTAHDMAPFAKEMAYVDANGEARPPFAWDEERRLRLCAKLDAIYFHLYGVTDRDDVRYVYSTFPIIEREEVDTHGRYLSRDLCLAWMNALAAGDPDADIQV